MEKRLIIAIGLSVLVIVMFQVLSPAPRKPQPVTERMAVSPVNRQTVPAESFQEPAGEGETTEAETEKYILSFTNIGGSLEGIGLKEYIEPATSSPLALVSDAEGDRAIFSMKSDILTRQLDRKKFTLIKKDKNKIVYAYSIPGSFKIVKEYYLYNLNDYIELRILIQNLSDSTIYRDYDIMGASCIQSTGAPMGRRFTEIDSLIDGKLVRNTAVKNNESFIKGIVSWTGLKERHFCIILKPQQDSEGVILKQYGKSSLASGVRTKRIPIYSGRMVEDSYILYIGPNDIASLRKTGFGLEQIVNYGIFGGITRTLLVILRIFHKVVKNWGVAIIMLTFLINIILFPLTRKSFLSMHKIQEIQPHIEKLRKVHKDNPQRLNKELAGLYKQYNVNPLGGCLPLLIQMPIFIALYQGLIRSIELKGANFLWIQDLSRPDSVQIPFTLPVLGNHIHLLPLLMVGAMFFQQRISAKSTPTTSNEQKQQQKIMLLVFPIFFGFLFYNFPSGLVLYWLTNTVLTVIEHSTMKRALGSR